VRSQKQLAYVTRQRVKDSGKPRTRIGVGVVDLATGVRRRSIEVPAPAAATGTVRIGYSTKKPAGFIVRVGKRTWRLAPRDGKLALSPVPAKARADAPAYLADMTRLVVRGRTAQLERTAVA